MRGSGPGIEGGAGEFEAIEAESGFERAAVGADEAVLLATQAISTGHRGADGRGA